MNHDVNDLRTIKFEFKCKKSKQKLLIDMLLNYSNYDLKTLATLLSVPVNKLLSVYKGESYLYQTSEISLAETFLVAFFD